jgi:hypothetical protein
MLFRGRGIALGQGKKNKPEALIKIRPIVIQDPFHNLAAHMIATYNSDKAIEICGPGQLGNDIKGGPEILVHTIKCLLQLHPDWTLISFDGKDAFNSLNRTEIINTLKKHCPNMVPYTTSLFNNASEVIYFDKSNKITLKVQQSNGIQQGNSAATRSYNITQSTAINNVKAKHPNIFILQIHDDQFILGPLDEALAALTTLKYEMLNIGIQESVGKSNIYSPTPISLDDEMRCKHSYNLKLVPSNDGVIVAGIPIGSDIFIKNTLSDIVDGIEVQIDTLLSAHLNISTGPKTDIHTLFNILKLCIPSQFNEFLAKKEVQQNQLLVSVMTIFKIFCFITLKHCQDYSLFYNS